MLRYFWTFRKKNHARVVCGRRYFSPPSPLCSLLHACRSSATFRLALKHPSVEGKSHVSPTSNAFSAITHTQPPTEGLTCPRGAEVLLQELAKRSDNCTGVFLTPYKSGKGCSLVANFHTWNCSKDVLVPLRQKSIFRGQTTRI